MKAPYSGALAASRSQNVSGNRPRKEIHGGGNSFPENGNEPETSTEHAMIKPKLEPITLEAVQDVLRLLDVYAPDVFDIEMAAGVVSRSLQAVHRYPYQPAVTKDAHKE